MATQVERLVKLETLTDNQQTQLNNHEDRIKTLEEITKVVDKMADTVSKQSDNIDKLTNAIDVIKDTTTTLQVKQAELETRQNYVFTEGIVNIFKNIKPKDAIMFMMAIVILIGALFGKQVINTETQKQVTEIINELGQKE